MPEGRRPKHPLGVAFERHFPDETSEVSKVLETSEA